MFVKFLWKKKNEYQFLNYIKIWRSLLKGEVFVFDDDDHDVNHRVNKDNRGKTLISLYQCDGSEFKYHTSFNIFWKIVELFGWVFKISSHKNRKSPDSYEYNQKIAKVIIGRGVSEKTASRLWYSKMTTILYCR